MMPAVETQALFQNLVAGEPVAVENLEIVPLLMRAAAAEADALLLEEAIQTGQTVVSEVSEGGIVGRVRVLHRGGMPLLVLQGEQILGAKQNRSFNASFIVAPGKEVLLPVSCVEQGRWRRKSAEFVAGATTISPTIRAQKLKRVSDSITMHGTYDANQSEVWGGVRDYMRATGAHSLTGSYEDARQTRAPEIEQTLQRLEPLAGQAGIAVVRDGRVLVLDAFGSARLFARAFKKCLRGALSDAALGQNRTQQAPGTSAREVVARLLEELARTDATRAPSPADSDTWTAHSKSGAYTAAVWNGSVYHCAAAG